MDNLILIKVYTNENLKENWNIYIITYIEFLLIDYTIYYNNINDKCRGIVYNRKVVTHNVICLSSQEYLPSCNLTYVRSVVL